MFTNLTKKLFWGGGALVLSLALYRIVMMKGRPTFSKFYYYFAFSMDDGPLIAAGSAGSSHLPTLTRFDSKLMESRGYWAVCSCTVSAALIQQFWVWALAGPLRMSSLFLYVSPVFFMYSGQSNISQQIQYRNRWKNPAASIKPDITKLANFFVNQCHSSDSLFLLLFGKYELFLIISRYIC